MRLGVIGAALITAAFVIIHFVNKIQPQGTINVIVRVFVLALLVPGVVFFMNWLLLKRKDGEQ